MAFGTFTLTIGGERQDNTPETTAKLHLRSQAVDTLRDGDGDEFKFPTRYAHPAGVAVSLPIALTLFTDSTSGDSTTIGYEGWVSTSNGGRVEFQFAAPQAGSTIALTDVTPAVIVPVNEAMQYVAEAEAARDAALVAETNAETAAASVQREQASGVAGLTSAGKLYETRIPDRLSDASLSATYAVRTDKREPDALRTFRAALAGSRVGGACDILVIGDSISEGTGPTLIENRWQSKFRDQIRTKYGVTGGRGYVPTNYGVTPAQSDELWVASGGAIDANSLDRGLGKRNMRLNAAGHKMTLNVPIGVTDVDIFIAAVSSETSWFKPTIDGVAGSNVNVQTSAPASRRDLVFNVATGLNSAVTHTIDIEWVLGNVWLSGAMLYKGDKVSGIRLWDGARHGQSSAFFATLADSWWLTVNTIQPDLVAIALGRNDWSTGVSVATYKANIETIISGIRTQTTNDPSILLMPVYGTVAGGVPVAPWSDYVAALKEIADADAGEVSVLDLYARMGTVTDAASNALGITASDFVHPSNLGSQMISDAVLDFVTAPV